MHNLREARDLGVPTYFGDILSEAAEHHLDVHNYEFMIAVTDNDAYNTLVTTDWGPEFGRANVFQTARDKESWSRYALPASLGGARLPMGQGLAIYWTRCGQGGHAARPRSAQNIQSINSVQIGQMRS